MLFLHTSYLNDGKPKQTKEFRSFLYRYPLFFLFPINVCCSTDKNQIFYCNRGLVHDNGDKEIVVADKTGKIKNELLEVGPKSKVSFGNNTSLYCCDKNVNICPNFTSQIFRVTPDSLYCIYDFSFGKYQIISDDFFIKHKDSGAIMDELYSEKSPEWVAYLLVYETTEKMLIEYFVKTRMFVGIWDKQTARVTHHFEYNKVEDNLGFGGVYPYPIGCSNGMYIGEIKPHKIDPKLLKDEELKQLTENMSEDDNSILVIYSLKK